MIRVQKKIRYRPGQPRTNLPRRPPPPIHYGKRVQYRLEAMTTPATEIIDLCSVDLSPASFGSLPHEPLLDTVKLSCGFLGFDDVFASQTSLLAIIEVEDLIQFADQMKQRFTKQMQRVGIEDIHYAIHGFEIAFPIATRFEAAHIESGQKVMVRSSKALKEWLRQIYSEQQIGLAELVVRIARVDDQPWTKDWRSEDELTAFQNTTTSGEEAGDEAQQMTASLQRLAIRRTHRENQPDRPEQVHRSRG